MKPRLFDLFILSLLIPLGLVVFIGLFGFFGFLAPETQEEKHQRKMRPMITSVDAFVEKHGRCPYDEEARGLLEDEIGGHFVLRNSDIYVSKQGGTGANDYVLGYWCSEWYYCYRSWDQTYYRDHRHEFLP